MRSFTEYLLESIEEKKYTFKIKVAGDLPENCEDVMETALKKYEVCKFTKIKTTPIQAKLKDFPTLENSQVTIFEVELTYPTTSTVLHNYLSEQTGLSLALMKVRSPLEEAESELNVKNDETDGKALLSQDYQKENHQDKVGDKGIANFLKELTKARKESGPTQYKGVNDKILAKKSHVEKSSEMSKPGPAKSILSSQSGNPDPRKGK